MIDAIKTAAHITTWLKDYCDSAKMTGFVVGVSGGIDSAVTSTLCALTGKKVITLSLPINRAETATDLARRHIARLEARFDNVTGMDLDLSSAFSAVKKALPEEIGDDLTMANTQSRLRMLALYAVANHHRLLVAGTGNKVEDFGIGFFTKYGDGGVDLSPIADLLKSEVYELAETLGILKAIIQAPPTDGLWADNRTDEAQIGATYAELEWAMDFEEKSKAETGLSNRQREVLAIYRRFNRANRHKMIPIPVCKIPGHLRKPAA